MKCMKCGSAAYESTTTEAIELDNGGLLVVRNIPCYKCRECDEVCYRGDVAEQLEKITEAAKKLSQELMVIDYTRAA